MPLRASSGGTPSSGQYDTTFYQKALSCCYGKGLVTEESLLHFTERMALFCFLTKTISIFHHISTSVHYYSRTTSTPPSGSTRTILEGSARVASSWRQLTT
jgi:hypothetical protein